MKNALKTLFYPFEQGFIEQPADHAQIAFICADYHPWLDRYKGPNLSLFNHSKIEANRLEHAGFSVQNSFNAADAQYDFILIILPKNKLESEALIVSGLKALKPDGHLICAADNKAGGGRLTKTLKAFALQYVEDFTKYKARVCVCKPDGSDDDKIHQALDNAAMQKASHGFITMPGIFGWNKIDKGSAILVEHLGNLAGRVADFGCGYGYLSDFALQHFPVTDLICVDADARAVEAAKQNLSAYDTKIEYLWADLTQPQPQIRDLDFIVMNPPFHQDKKTDSSIGQAFIQRASECLKPGGMLYMVANTHLPYEKILQQHFSTTKKPHEAQGFKVFHSEK